MSTTTYVLVEKYEKLSTNFGKKSALPGSMLARS